MFVKAHFETERVKSLCFHTSRPWLLVSFSTGEIQVLDFETNSVIQKYNDHQVIVRSVHFHASRSLFCSGSDDKTVRLFNFEKKCCIHTFTDHLDYVRSVQFHPRLPFIVSSSDDQTIRIFDFQKKVQVSIISGHSHYVMSAFFHPTRDLLVSCSLDNSVKIWDTSNIGTGGGLFSSSDATLLFSKEEHTSGVNHVSWNPKKQQIFSSSDDRTIKIWFYSQFELQPVATLRSHTDIVNCAVAHPLLNVVISCSEDGTVRVWEENKFTFLVKYSQPKSRFWHLAAHSKKPIFAAGHDNGVLIFRLLRNRPAVYRTNDYLFFARNFNSVQRYSLKTKTFQWIAESPNTASPLEQPPRDLALSADEKHLLLVFEEKFELHSIDGSSSKSFKFSKSGKSATFVSRTEIAFLQENGTTLTISDLNNSKTKTFNVPHSERLFYAGSPGNVFLTSKTKLFLFDTQFRKTTEFNFPNIKFLSSNKKFIVLASSQQLTVSKVDFSNPIVIPEKKFKTGFWLLDIFFYSTNNFVKYLLPNGDSGLVVSIVDFQEFLFLNSDTIFFFDHTQSVKDSHVDVTEAFFKYYLFIGNFQKANYILKTSRLCSQSITEFVFANGRVDPIFITDPKLRFQISVKSGELNFAKQAAEELNQTEIWSELADQALFLGKFDMYEYALIKSNNERKLAFFYLISGQITKLQNLNTSPSLKLQSSIWLNDKESLISLLKNASPTLALAAGVSAQIPSFAENSSEIVQKIKLFSQPSTHEAIEDHECKNFDIIIAQSEEPRLEISSNEKESKFSGEWEEEISTKNQISTNEEEEDGWGLIGDIPTVNESNFVPISSVPLPSKRWISNASTPGDLVAVGQFGQALVLLRQMICLINFEKIKSHFISSYVASHPFIPTFLDLAFEVPITDPNYHIPLPIPALSIERIRSQMALGFQVTTEGKFQKSLSIFLELLQNLPLAVASSKEEEKDISNSITKCRNYVTGMLLAKERNSFRQNNKEKYLEMSFFMAKCGLEDEHRILALLQAGRGALEGKNAPIAEYCGETVLSLHCLNDDMKKKARMLLNGASQLGRTESSIDPKKSFELCCGTWTPIYSGQSFLRCPFCGAYYTNSFANEVCKICELCAVGGQGSGLKILRSEV